MPSRQFFKNFKAELDQISPDGPSWIDNAARLIDERADSGDRAYAQLRAHLRKNPTVETYLQEMEELINGRTSMPDQPATLVDKIKVRFNRVREAAAGATRTTAKPGKRRH